jgi:hypothetical protein
MWVVPRPDGVRVGVGNTGKRGGAWCCGLRGGGGGGGHTKEKGGMVWPFGVGVGVTYKGKVQQPKNALTNQKLL